MNTNLSKRLQMVASLVPEDMIVADIGTDHAMLPIALIESGNNPYCIATDVKEGPLAQAGNRLSQVDEEISCCIERRLCDGLSGIEPGEADCVVLAGMGGELIKQILSQTNVRDLGVSCMVLQPQSAIKEVREFLRKERFTIEAERITLEDGKFYPAMRVATAGKEAQPYAACTKVLAEVTANAVEAVSVSLRYGPLLLQEKNMVLREFVYRDKDRISRALVQMTNGASTDTERILQLQQEEKEAMAAAAFLNG